jgi:large subunit ribosomal protein L15
LPKRGFVNPARVEYQVVNVGQLGRVHGDVSPETLEAAGLIGTLQKPVKILGQGEVERPLSVTAHAFSASARAKIEAAGGSVRLIARGDEAE